MSQSLLNQGIFQRIKISLPESIILARSQSLLNQGIFQLDIDLEETGWNSIEVAIPFESGHLSTMKCQIFDHKAEVEVAIPFESGHLST